MNTPVHSLLLPMFCLASLPANATAQNIEYYGVDPEADMHSAAIVIFDTSANATSSRKCFLSTIANESMGDSKRIQEGTSTFALRPGPYLIRGFFNDMGKEAILLKDYRFEAGQKYRATCTGRSIQRAAIAITKIED